MKAVVFFLLSLIFVLGGIWMVRDGEPIGYFISSFFALGLPVFALQFHPKAAYLHLAPDGFTFCALFRAHTIPWGQVQEFAVTSIFSHRTVAWDFTPDYPATRRARAIAKFCSGYEAALPDTFGMKAHELASLMESLRQRHTQRKLLGSVVALQSGSSAQLTCGIGVHSQGQLRTNGQIMKNKFDISSIVCGALLGATIVFTLGAANGKRTSWEYTTHYYNSSHPDTAALTKLGNDGWEMVAYFAGPEGKQPGFVFKRER